jgi:hypothetical protein
LTNNAHKVFDAVTNETATIVYRIINHANIVLVEIKVMIDMLKL